MIGLEKIESWEDTGILLYVSDKIKKQIDAYNQ